MKRNKSVVFKSNAPFINCILKINRVQIDNAEDLDLAMPMYNLLEYSKLLLSGTITEMNQVILIPLNLNLLNTRQVLQEILTMLVLVKMVMTQTKLAKIELKLLFH